MNLMKTPITVLQELMVKKGLQPEYQFISKSGPDHSMTFEYECSALGATVRAVARSKKDAKQEAARKMLVVLASRGQPVPPPYNMDTTNQPTVTVTTTPTKSSPPPASFNRPSPDNDESDETAIKRKKTECRASNPDVAFKYVALLKDMCIEYHLPGVEFDLVSDVGPPHHRMFTIRARLGQHERLATAGTKKAARQMAAEKLYNYMRENLGRLTKDFVEEEAIARQHERVMERYVEMRDESSWRPDLGQRVADYHLGLASHIEPDKCELARRALENISDDEDDWETPVNNAATALGLTINKGSLETFSAASSLTVVELTPTSPALCFCAASPAAAYRKAAHHLRHALA